MKPKCLLILPLLVASLQAASVDDLTFRQNGQTYTVSSCIDTASGLLIIPSTYQGLPVTSIESLSHTVNTYSNNISAIIIPDSVTSIGEMAFIRCQNLTDLIVSELHNSYRSVDGFLLNKSGDTLVAYPTGRNYLADTIPDSVTIIGNSAFRGNDNITAVAIPNSITTIGSLAFYSCDNITSISIPSSVTSISTYAFGAIESLTEYVVANENTSYFSEDGVLFEQLVDGISIFAYPSAKSGDSYTVPAGVTVIRSDSFSGSDLSNINFSDSVTTIEGGAFIGCSLISVTIPDSVTTIGAMAFYGSSYLTTVVIGDGVTTIKSDTFLDCDNLRNITIGNNVETIEYRAFAGSGYTAEVTDITIPSSVISIGDNALAMNNLGNITVSIGNTSYSSIDGVLYSYNQDEIIFYPRAKSGDSYTVPDGVTSVGNNAFSESSLTSITLPNGLLEIGDSAFASSYYALSNINIPASVTSIGDGAFAYNVGISSITIPASVASIGDSAFYDCRGLTEINVSNANAYYSSNDGVLFNKSEDTLITYPAGKIGEEFTVPDGVTSVGNNAFNGSGLTSISLPDSVTSIGIRAFSSTNISYDYTADDLNYLISRSGQTAYLILGNQSSGSVNIPNQVNTAYVKVISGSAFAYSRLSSITISDSVISIGGNAFSYCNSLTSVDLPDSLLEIGDRAFAGSHYAFSSLNIPASVISIGDRAFSNCDGLSSVTIPASVTSIGDSAFKYSDNLDTVTSEAITAPILGSNAFENIPATKITIPIGSKQSYLEAGDGTSYGGLAISYGSLIDGAISEARTEGQQDVITSPLSYGLYSPSYVISLLDSSRTAGQNDVTGDPSSYGLYSEQGITDLRAGSTILQLGPNNSATLELQIERSNDLSNWTTNTDDLVEVQMPLSGDTEFFRFKMTE